MSPSFGSSWSLCCCSLFRKTFAFRHSLRLSKMPLAMNDKDGERILQAVRNKTQQRRRDYRFRRVEVGRERSQILDQLVLMFRESFDYVTADLAGGRKRFRGRLHFLLVFRVEALDQEPAEESAE